MKNKTGFLIGGGIALAVIILLCILLPKPKVIDSGDTECLFPYTYQESGDGILLTITGEFAANGWQVSGAENAAISVVQKKNQQNKASFRITPQEEGYAELVFTLEDGSEQNGYQIIILFYVDIDGTLAVGESSHIAYHEYVFDGTLGDWSYTGKVVQNVLELEMQGTDDAAWNLVSEMTNLNMEGPLRSLSFEDIASVEEETKTKQKKNKIETTEESENEESEEAEQYADSAAEGEAGTEQLAVATIIERFTVTAYGSDAGTITACCAENQLALCLTLETDESGQITVVSCEPVTYESSTMDATILAQQEAMDVVGENALRFEGFEPRNYGVSVEYSDIGVSFQIAYLLITVNEADWYCEMTVDLEAEPFSTARAYKNAVNRTETIAETTVILSQAESTMTVFWEQDGVTYRISSQADATEEEALAAVKALMESGKSAS